MALKPPPLNDVLHQLNELVGKSGLRDEADKTVRALTQSALGRLDVVNREDFDAQAAVLHRTRARVAALEAELEALTREFEASQRQT
ncbi:accessory factor UbiK family protein [Kineobactrum salinum]|uniref:Ubiquinone biosynthesis accessory factor UbiK n=1 Tax=Kineobactrum salinum TaxID=2708301 RepID=A0A6C0TZL1_9GAMM|nr:accessory factor UbiK family protein [Kineobactrum salinum]QIB65270.1 accessory factor UbiK family protein [Kineobactrum salinum]